jgi:hypothetical protein
VCHSAKYTLYVIIINNCVNVSCVVFQQKR